MATKRKYNYDRLYGFKLASFWISSIALTFFIYYKIGQFLLG